MPTDFAADVLCINTLRCLAIDAIEAAKSGHPGLPLGAAPMAQMLWGRHLRVSAQAPQWPNRDRFVLSAGHGSMLLYALLHLYGFDVRVDDLAAFRKLHSRTPGHPEFGVTQGVEATTGPLGQGAGNSVGMAIAERALAHRFNRPGHSLIDHATYALVSDGDLMEGVAHEAAALAGHLALGKLIWLYDANAVTLDGPADLSHSENTAQRFAAYGWQVLTVDDGDHDLGSLDAALATARAHTAQPSLLIVRTTIGYGAPNKQGTSSSHGAPLGPAEAQATKTALGADPNEAWAVPQGARDHADARARAMARAMRLWEQGAKSYAQAHPELWRQFEAAMAQARPDGWDTALAQVAVDEAMSTREAGRRAMAAAASLLPALIGGDADLSVSTLTAIGDGGNFDGASGAGRNIRFGVREHAMAAAANGIAYHGGLAPYTATFLVFSDYMRPAMRMAALSALPVLFIFTHDSVGVGEDGPTHQPIEHLAAMRAMPNLAVMRPADAAETCALYRAALGGVWSGPVAMVLGRQKVPALPRDVAGWPQGLAAANAARGAYVLPREGPAAGAQSAAEGLFIATGSEVQVALAAAALLAERGVCVDVISMPCWELFEAQSASYREAVLPRACRARVAVEAASTFGWCRWVGDAGRVLGVDTFGTSGPGPEVMAHLGFTPEAAVQAMTDVLCALR